MTSYLWIGSCLLFTTNCKNLLYYDAHLDVTFYDNCNSNTWTQIS